MSARGLERQRTMEPLSNSRAQPLEAASATGMERRLRRFLLVVTGAVCAVTPLELWFNKHFDSPMQLVPFVLCGLGLLVTALALWRPQRTTLLALRGTMVLLVAGSLLGMVEHVTANLGFALEIRPAASLGTVLLPTLQGAAPLLAPGILALAAILAIGATWSDPLLD